MYWLIGSIIFVFVLAFIIIKLSVNTNANPDSGLGILEHPSAFKKQDIEMVDKHLKSDYNSSAEDNSISN